MEKKYKAYKFRLYPNKAQRVLLAKIFGCVRFIYNFFLCYRKFYYDIAGKGVYYKDCSAQLTEMKAMNEYAWLNEADSCALQSTLKNLDRAYINFFKGLADYPTKKRKSNHWDSYTTKNSHNCIEVIGNHVKLPKLGMVRIKATQSVLGNIVNATISKEPNGHYYVSIMAEYNEHYAMPKTGKSVGIDLGIKHFAYLSTGEVIENPQFLEKNLRKLKLEQRKLARKMDPHAINLAMKDILNGKTEVDDKYIGRVDFGSNRYEKQRMRVADLHAYIRHSREDFLQKVTTRLVNEFDVICVEDLNIAGMSKNHRLARRIHDCGWGRFVALLEDKCKRYGKTLVKVGRFYASSQTCHKCGHKEPSVKDLGVRDWTCPRCGTHHDRDENASINILNEGLRILKEPKETKEQIKITPRSRNKKAA